MWHCRGTIPQGSVYKASKTTLHRPVGLCKDVFMFYETEPSWIPHDVNNRLDWLKWNMLTANICFVSQTQCRRRTTRQKNEAVKMNWRRLHHLYGRWAIWVLSCDLPRAKLYMLKLYSKSSQIESFNDMPYEQQDSHKTVKCLLIMYEILCSATIWI